MSVQLYDVTDTGDVYHTGFGPTCRFLIRFLYPGLDIDAAPNAAELREMMKEVDQNTKTLYRHCRHGHVTVHSSLEKLKQEVGIA